ncbi:hypothetical protein FQA39_LY04628 [Lamprigera yunnana]|nr:hypothetical protein FQA39_LY04628 [Lamprigera yunnana]
MLHVDKTDRTGLIGAECTCTHNSLRTVSSRKDARKHWLPKGFTATGRKFRRKTCLLWICKIGQYNLFVTTILTQVPVYNLPLAQVVIDAVNKAKHSNQTISTTKSLTENGNSESELSDPVYEDDDNIEAEMREQEDLEKCVEEISKPIEDITSDDWIMVK